MRFAKRRRRTRSSFAQGDSMPEGTQGRLWTVFIGLACTALVGGACPSSGEAQFGRGGLGTCYDCAAERYVTSCSGCSGSEGGQCDNCGSCRTRTWSWPVSATVNYCGGQGDNGVCWCDASCTSFGDCCHDFQQECSCAGNCDGRANSCWCDFACESLGDCCPDKFAQCGACDPADEPGTNGNPFCFEGHGCCGTEWTCGSATGHVSCN